MEPTVMASLPGCHRPQILQSLKNHLIRKANLAELLLRYDDMVSCMCDISMLHIELNDYEQEKFSRAYSYVLEAKKINWLIMCTQEEIANERGDQEYLEAVIVYKHEIESEWGHFCKKLFDNINDHLLPFARNNKSIITYNRMKGDVTKSMGEFSVGHQKQQAINLAIIYYNTAKQLADSYLSPNCPERINIHLSYGKLYNDLLRQPGSAHVIGNAALWEALRCTDYLNQAQYERSFRVLSSLRHHLEIWSNNAKMVPAPHRVGTQQQQLTFVQPCQSTNHSCHQPVNSVNASL